jgi:AraC family transcriptional regulator
MRARCPSDAPATSRSSQVIHQLRLDGMCVTELRHLPGRLLSPHVHDTASLCVLLEGGATERCGVDIHVSRLLTVVGRRAGTPHANQFHARGARWLIVDLDPADHGVHTALSHTARRTSAYPAAALVSAFRSRRTQRVRRVRRAVRHLLESMRMTRSPDPAWLDAAREILVARLAAPPTIAALAREVGVHPVHLAQTFRARLGTTPKRFLRAHRTFRAVELVAQGVPLVEVARDVGFADQSHMTRTLHRERGAPPGALRALWDREP